MSVDSFTTMTNSDQLAARASEGVSILPIAQATTATFTDLYIQYTFVVFIEVGSKRVLCPLQGELIAYAGDVLIFPPGSVVTIENRPVVDRDYRATGVCGCYSGDSQRHHITRTD